MRYAIVMQTCSFQVTTNLLVFFVWIAIDFAAYGQVSKWTVTTFAGKAGEAGNRDGPGDSARFARPVGLAVDLDNNLYVADDSNNSIRKITPSGVVSTVATGLTRPNGIAVDIGNNIFAIYGSSLAKITSNGTKQIFTHSNVLEGICLDGDDLYLTSPADRNVWKVSTDGQMTLIFAGGVIGRGITAAKDGTLFIAGAGAQIISRIALHGQVDPWAGADGQVGIEDGPKEQARFNDPSFLTVDSDGNILVTDRFNYTVRRIATNGNVTTLAGIPGQEGDKDGSSAIAKFRELAGIAIDSLGNIYVADLGNSTIRKLAPDFGSHLTGYYPLNQNANDLSIHSRNGVVFGAVPAEDRFSKPASSFKFSNSDDKITIPIGAKEFENDYTISLWMYIEDLSTSEALMVLAGDLGAVRLSIAGKNSNDHKLRGRIGFYMFQESPWLQLPHGVLWSANPVEEKRWYHLTVTRSGPKFSMFLDGELVAQKSDESQIQVAGTFLRLGLGNVNQTELEPFKGLLDDLRIYNQVIDISYVKRLAMDQFSSPLIRATSVFAGTLGMPGTIDGKGTNALFISPNSVALDLEGNIYVTDSQPNVGSVRRINSEGVVTTLPQKFNNPNAIHVDLSGRIYVAETGKVTVVGTDGQITSAFTSAAWFAAIATDPDGAVYATDPSRHTVWRKKLNEPAEQSYVSIDGIPLGLVKSGSHFFVSSDSYKAGNGGAIYKIDTTGAAVYAGVPGSFGDNDGPRLSARFRQPSGLSLDARGNLYVTDNKAFTIRRVGTNGTVSTIASIPPINVGAVEGLGSLAINSQGSILYATHSANKVIYKIALLDIFAQPSSATIFAGNSASMHVLAAGQAPFAYQWYFKGSPLVGETNSVLSFEYAQLSDSGDYYVTVSNGLGQIQSTGALLHVKDLYASELSNMDSDNDNLSDYDEAFVYHLDPFSSDTGATGISDDKKVHYGLWRFKDFAVSALAGVSPLELINYNGTNKTRLSLNNSFPKEGSSIYDTIFPGARKVWYQYDKNDRLIGSEYSRGFSMGWGYDPNGNLVSQIVLSRTEETNGVPVLWLWRHGVANELPTIYSDSDGDGFSNYEEWLAGTDPKDPSSVPAVGFENTAPYVRIVAGVAAVGELTYLDLKAWDKEGSLILINLQFFDGHTWKNATLVNPGAKRMTSPDGRNVNVLWNARADLGSGVNATVMLRVRGVDLTAGRWSEPMSLNVSISANADSDNDGLPDEWEFANFGFLSQDANDDFDGDGLSNINEYRAGTDPKDSNSKLILTISITGGRMYLQWEANPRGIPLLEHSSNVSGPWTVIVTNAQPGEVSGNTPQHGYYRLKVEMP